jgi:hypothetical protein
MERLKSISTNWTKGILIVRSDVSSTVVGNRRFLRIRPDAFDLIINHCINVYILGLYKEIGWISAVEEEIMTEAGDETF